MNRHRLPATPWRVARLLPEFESLEQRRLMTASLDIVGVQPDAFSQPQIHALIRTTAAGAPLSVSDGFGGTTFDITGFLDTGTSEVLLSQETAQALRIAPATYGGQTISFGDVGVQGLEQFDVSNPLYVSLAPYTPTADVDNPSTYQSVYNQTFGPMRLELNAAPSDDLIGPLDIFGMPAMQGKVVVVDPTPPSSVTNFDDVHAWIYNPGTAFNGGTTNPGIPTTNRHVALSMVDLKGFTEVTPAGAPGPAQNANPFIGPNPLHALDSTIPAGTAPPVTITQGSYTGSGSFLFDTGAADSFISQGMASQVHVHYKAGTYNTDNPVLVDDSNTPVPNQFVRQLGGLGGGGILSVAGFFLSSLSVPTTEGQDIRFVQAPVLVVDVSTVDPISGKTFTLDGDFGMNYLTASANIDGWAASAGAFNWLVFDQPKGLLGLNIPGATVTDPANASIAGSVFNDLNGNNVRNTADAGRAGVTLYLDANRNAKLDPGETSTVSLSDGSYIFPGLSAGSYRVREVVPAGTRLSAAAATYYDVTLAVSGKVTGKTFANTVSVRITGSVFKDTNGNAKRDTGEAGLSAWTLYIDTNNNGKLDTGEVSTVSDSSGNWSFDGLAAGTSRIRIVQKTGYTRTTPTAGYLLVTLTAGTLATGKLFGEK